MKLSSEIAALVPAYNEEKNIKEVIERCKSFTNNIIVIDDGSTDKTAELSKNTILISHEKNLGKGEAIKTGTHYILKNMKNIENIVIIDADMQYNPEDSKILLEPLKNGNADFVMGYRNWKEVPFRHKLGNMIWKFIFNSLFKTKLKDVACGFVAMNRKSLETIQDIYGGYIIESSMLAECIINKLKIDQVPVSVKYHDVSGIIRGSKMVLGILIFIINKGIKYRMG